MVIQRYEDQLGQVRHTSHLSAVSSWVRKMEYVVRISHFRTSASGPLQSIQETGRQRVLLTFFCGNENLTKNLTVHGGILKCSVGVRKDNFFKGLGGTCLLLQEPIKILGKATAGT